MSSIFVVSAPVPDDVSTVTLQKIDAEHKVTRQFMANELTKRETEFLKEFTGRADYYEDSYEDIMKKSVWKLGILWSGILLFFISFNKMIDLKTEEKKYQVLKDAIKKDLMDEFRKENIELPEKDITIVKEMKQSSTIKPIEKKEVKKKKKGFFGKLFKKSKPKPQTKLSNKEKDELLLKMAKRLESSNQFAGEQKMPVQQPQTKRSLMEKMRNKR